MNNYIDFDAHYSNLSNIKLDWEENYQEILFTALNKLASEASPDYVLGIKRCFGWWSAFQIRVALPGNYEFVSEQEIKDRLIDIGFGKYDSRTPDLIRYLHLDETSLKAEVFGEGPSIPKGFSGYWCPQFPLLIVSKNSEIIDQYYFGWGDPSGRFSSRTLR